MSEDMHDWMRRFFAAADEHDAAIQDAWQRIENAGLINKVRVHEYRCRRCGPRVVVIRVGGHTLARTKEYKLGSGLNAKTSVPLAREKNTLNGENHWPGHTFDVDQMAEWGPDAGMTASCRHQTTVVKFADVLGATRRVAPGHPGKPTML